MNETKEACVSCVNDKSKPNKLKFFSPRGLKQHQTKIHNAPRANGHTTIEVSLATHKFLVDRKLHISETFDQELRRLLEMK